LSQDVDRFYITRELEIGREPQQVTLPASGPHEGADAES
jgi:hypothetical protein